MTGRWVRPVAQAPAVEIEPGAVEQAGCQLFGPLLASAVIVAAPAALAVASDPGVPGPVRVSMVVSFLVLFGGGVS